MPGRVTLSTRNLKGVVANVHARDRQLQKETKALVTRTGRQEHDLAVALCPFDTGFMQQHLNIRFSEQGYGYELGWQAADFTAAALPFYPPYQEFGTTKMPAQPCLFPARDYYRPRFQANLRRAVSRAVARAG